MPTSRLDKYVYNGREKVPKDVTAVVSISSEVTGIPSKAFRECRSLEEVSLSQNLNAANPLLRIGIAAFSSCTSLRRVQLSPHVTVIDKSAFKMCTQLDDFDLERAQQLEQIGDCALMECRSLSRVALGPMVQSLGAKAFFRCHRLQQVELNDQIVEIPDSCFKDCASLERLGVERATRLQVIGDHAFRGCSLLERVQFPPSLKEIWKSVFVSCENLRYVDFSQATQLESIGQFAFSRSGLITVDLTGTAVTAIEEYCFWRCFSLAQVLLSEALVEIEARAFDGCSALKDVRFPDKLQIIGEDAFLDCGALVRVALPSSIRDCLETPFDENHIESILFRGKDLELMIRLSLLYPNAISMDRMIFLHSFQPKLLNESWGQREEDKMREIQLAHADAMLQLVIWCVERGMRPIHTVNALQSTEQISCRINRSHGFCTNLLEFALGFNPRATCSGI